MRDTERLKEKVRGWLLGADWKIFNVTPKDETPWILRSSFGVAPSVWIYPMPRQDALVFRCRYDMDEAVKRLWENNEFERRHLIASEVRIQLVTFGSEFELAEECSAFTTYELVYSDALNSLGQDIFWQRLRRTRNALLGAMYVLAKHLNVADLASNEPVN